MALNYMWVVSTGRKPRPVSERVGERERGREREREREREPRPWESIVSEIGERGRDRDDRQATRSAAATRAPSHPTHPHPSTQAPLSLALLGQSTGKVRWRLPAPSRWVMMELSVSVSYRFPSKHNSPPKKKLI